MAVSADSVSTASQPWPPKSLMPQEAENACDTRSAGLVSLRWLTNIVQRSGGGQVSVAEPTIGVAVEDDEKKQSGSAPYMSYKGFKNYLVKFGENGVPARFDSSYFGNVSGSLIAQVRGTLHHLDLIDDERRPTELLKKIVSADDAGRKTYLREIFEEKYSDALSLDKNATSGQLAEVFRARGLGGATVQKAASFFLSMAQDVGVEVSPLFKKSGTPSTNGGARRRRASRTQQTPPPPPPRIDPPKATTVEEQKAAYVTMLMDLAKNSQDETVQDSILNRIERALGIGGEGDNQRDLP
jgi:hypothetical protein